jgi:hypothetical protein
MIYGTVTEIGLGASCTGAEVFLFSGLLQDDSSFVSKTSLDSLHRFEFRNLESGKYHVAIIGPKMEGDGVGRIRVACDSASIVRLVAKPKGSSFLNIEVFPKLWGSRLYQSARWTL